MRPDMSKVIVERPRRGSERHVARRFRRFDPKLIDTSEDADGAFAGGVGHRRAAALAGDRKSLNENLTPLRRFLISQVGRPWSKVWSEISAHVRADNTVQQHVRDHIEDFVATRTFMRDGIVFIPSRLGGLSALAQCRHPELYVDPRTGLLCRNKRYRTYAADRRRAEELRKKALTQRLREIDVEQQFHLLADGNWWEVTLAPVPQEQVPGRYRPRLIDLPVVDVVERARLSPLPREELYDRRGVFAVAKRPLSAKEIKGHELRDP